MAVDMITGPKSVSEPTTKALTKSTTHSPAVMCANTPIIAPIALPSTSSTTVTLTSKRKQKIGFFSLPGELRNKIYRLALPKKGDIVLAGLPLGQLMCQSAPGIVFAYPRFFAEAGSIFFLENTFWFEENTLNRAAFEILENAAGKHGDNFTKIGIRRTYTIGDMKPIVVTFTVEMIDGKIKVIRPENEVMPFPGVPGYAKFRSPYTEPCRCQVRALAKKMTPTPDRRVGMPDILDFVREYIVMTRTPGREQFFTICQKCETVRRR